MDRGYTDYPGIGGTYGMQNLSDMGGVPEAMRGWNSGLYFPKLDAKKPVQTERDYEALNRCAVEAGLVTAPEYREFRVANDMRRRVDEKIQKVKRRCEVRKMPPSFVYGISTR